MAHLEVLAEPAGPVIPVAGAGGSGRGGGGGGVDGNHSQPQHGRLTLRTVVPTDRLSIGGRTAFNVGIDLTEAAEDRGLLPTVLAGLLFTLAEDLVGVVAEVTFLRSPAQRLVFATEDRRSLRSVIAQHWLSDRRLQFHVCPLDSFRRAVTALREGQPFDPALASLRVAQNQNRSGLIVRGDSLNTVRARNQVHRLCLQYDLDLDT